MTIESPIVAATRTRKDLAEAAGRETTLEITIPKAVAALIVGIPASSLNSSIALTPINEQMNLTISPDRRHMALVAFSAWSDCKNKGLKNDFSQRQYRALYGFLQQGFRGQARSVFDREDGLFLAVLGQSDESFQQILDHASQTGRIEELDLETVGKKLVEVWGQLPKEYQNTTSFVPENVLNAIAGS